MKDTKGTNETDIWPADSNEAGLRTDMVSALRASNEFARWLLNEVCKQSAIDQLIVDPHVEQRLKNSIIDIDLKFRGTTNYRFGIELKLGTADVDIEQLERHLYGLNIMQKNRWALTRFASNEDRVLKLVVITGTANEPKAVNIIRTKPRFGDKIVWISWHKVVDELASLPSDVQDDPNVFPLIDSLKKLGFSPSKFTFQKLSNIDRYTKHIKMVKPIQDRFNEELDILEAVLQRIDYEMNNLHYTQAKSMKITKLPRGKIDRKLNSFLPARLKRKFEGTPVPLWIGRLYVPELEIQSLKHLVESKSISYGIAIGYDLTDNIWLCHIEPMPKKPIKKELLANAQFKTNEREPVLYRNGWIIKGRQRNPIKISKFMDAVWKQYTS
ncbi:MAG: hypothetical protein V3R93_06950 [Candidatus Hydrothermarchaeaceae archaeon]